MPDCNGKTGKMRGIIRGLTTETQRHREEEQHLFRPSLCLCVSVVSPSKHPAGVGCNIPRRDATANSAATHARRTSLRTLHPTPAECLVLLRAEGRDPAGQLLVRVRP